MHAVTATSALLFLALGATAVGRQGAVVQGRVTFAGDVPEATTLPINKDQEVCGDSTREQVPVKVTPDGGLADVVVYVDTRGEMLGAWEHPAGGYVLDQKGCFFEPYILVFPRDPAQKLRIVNSDPVLHNVHGYELIGRARRSLFNLSQPHGSEAREQALEISKRNHAILLKCDAHDFMNGYVFVVDNPFWALVKEDGTYAIEGVPPGEHTLSAWHPTLGTVSQKKVQVGADGSVAVDFEFVPQKASGRRR